MDLLCGYFVKSNLDLQAYIAHRMLCVQRTELLSGIFTVISI